MIKVDNMEISIESKIHVGLFGKVNGEMLRVEKGENNVVQLSLLNLIFQL